MIIDAFMYLQRINILFFIRFYVWSCIFELEVVRIFNLRGQKAYHCVQTYIMVDMRFYVWASISELKAVSIFKSRVISYKAKLPLYTFLSFSVRNIVVQCNGCRRLKMVGIQYNISK